MHVIGALSEVLTIRPWISIVYVFRFLPKKKGNTKTNSTPTRPRDNPEELFMFIGSSSPCFFPNIRKLEKAVAVGTEFGEGDAMKQTSVKKSAFSLNEGKAFSEWRLWSGTLQERPFAEEVPAIHIL